MPDQTSGRSYQVSGYIRMFASLKSDHIVIYISFLSHLLIAGCDIGVQLSVRPFVRQSVSPSVNNLRRVIKCLSYVPMIARIMKPCIVIVLDILYKHAP